MIRRRRGAQRQQPALPDLALPSAGGGEVRLREIAESRSLVIYFYPGSGAGVRWPELAGCTVEACAFRDAMHALASLDTAVIGVSFEEPTRQAEFAAKNELNFPLLWDEAGELARSLGVPVVRREGERFPKRTTFLFARGGHFTARLEDMDAERHAEEVLRLVAANSADG